MDGVIESNVAEQATRSFSAGRRWLIVASSAVMAGLVLAGTFAIGVWVGAGRPETTATFGGFGGPPPGLGAFQPPAGQGQRGAAPFGALSRPADIIGQIGSLNGDSLTVNSQTGPRVVTLTSDTEILLSDGTAGSRTDLQRGRVVGIVGTPGNGGLSFTAEEVAVGQ